MKYNTFTLPNGLRIIHLYAASPVVYCGYQIACGTRNENPGDEGLAHFCEHTTFKGTRRRSAMQILNRLEKVGGDLNAFTNKEDTVYYSAILKDHLPRAVDLLTDIVFHSTYPQHELDKEVEVICDEIESYLDSPAEQIFDDFENLVFEGHPLGHNILGKAGRLRQYTSADALRFVRRYYRTDNSVFFAYGDVDFKKLVHLLRTATKDLGGAEAQPAATSCLRDARCGMDGGAAPVRPLAPLPAYTPRQTILDKGTHQAHVMLGCRSYSIHDKKRMPLYLLNNLLGGPGMNARLNIALRERHALVYTVESSMVSYSDTGVWCIYFGCDPHDVRKCLKLVRRELDKMMNRPLTDRQLHAAKRQIKGQIGVACDNRESYALDFGKSFLHYGWEKDIARLYEHIDAITAPQMQEVAQEIFAPERLTTLIFK